MRTEENWYDTIRRMRFTTQWRTAFRVKSFKAVVIRGKLSGEGGGGGGGGGWRLEIAGGTVFFCFFFIGNKEGLHYTLSADSPTAGASI